MADISSVYTLTTPGGTVLFNDGSQSDSGIDKLYITSITGLDGTDLRTPMDDVPFGHGSLWYDWWEAGRPMIIDGSFLIVSTRVGNQILAIRNQFEEDLRVPLRSIGALEVDTGTLAWTPYGQSPRQLTVRNNMKFETGYSDNYLVETFHFGLFAADPDWDGWSS